MKMLKKAVIAGFSVAALASLTGCGGISASQGISPATFLLPGLVGTDKTKEPETNAPPAPSSVSGVPVQVASAQ